MKIETISINDVIINTELWNTTHKSVKGRLYKRLYNQIKINGQLLPLLVRKVDNKYEIIDGKIRYLIFKTLGYKDFYAVIIENISNNKMIALDLQLNYNVDLDVIRLSDKISYLLEVTTPQKLSFSTNFEPQGLEAYRDVADWDWEYFDKQVVPFEYIKGGILSKK